jgi:hypothetical protein
MQYIPMLIVAVGLVALVIGARKRYRRLIYYETQKQYSLPFD